MEDQKEIKFGTILRNARRSKDILQSQLSHHLEVAEPYICRLEKSSSLPSDKLLYKICQFFNLDLKQIFLQVLYERTEVPEFKQVLKEAMEILSCSKKPEDEIELLTFYRGLDRHQKELFWKNLANFKELTGLK